jgi:hypothetical protein
MEHTDILIVSVDVIEYMDTPFGVELLGSTLAILMNLHSIIMVIASLYTHILL